MLRYGAFLAFGASPAFADPGDHGHMMDWGYGHGPGMMFGPLIWLLVLGLIVAAAVWLVRRFDGGQSGGGALNARAELDMRLARGEIDAEDYAARKELLNA
jgi:putative membrane protein